MELVLELGGVCKIKKVGEKKIPDTEERVYYPVAARVTGAMRGLYGFRIFGREERESRNARIPGAEFVWQYLNSRSLPIT
jgi:hypothetical protein